MNFFFKYKMVLAVFPMVELVEVAEGVLEPSDHLGTHPDRFLPSRESCWTVTRTDSVSPTTPGNQDPALPFPKASPPSSTPLCFL